MLPTNKKLEDLFNMAPSEESTEVATIEVIEPEELETQLQTFNANIDKIDAALPAVRDLDATDKEMDDIAKLATDTFNDLVTLSMSVDPRFSGGILQSAASVLGHALTAKTAKIDAKMKMIDLQLKKMKLDQTAEKKPADDSGTITDGDGVVLDRNELLNRILNGNRRV
jgi:hypothetical protein